jgi:hypothetical protein
VQLRIFGNLYKSSDRPAARLTDYTSIETLIFTTRSTCLKARPCTIATLLPVEYHATGRAVEATEQLSPRCRTAIVNEGETVNGNRMKLALAMMSGSAILCSIVFVGSQSEQSLTYVNAGGTGRSPTGTSYTQPTAPDVQFASTVTNTPSSVDGSAPTELATSVAVINPANAAPAAPECRHWDICFAPTLGMAPKDHQ